MPPRAASAPARAALEQTLLLELRDDEAVRGNSTAWGELRSTAVFEDYLREQLLESTRTWIGDITKLTERALAQDLPQELRAGDDVILGGELHCVICRHDFRPWHNQRDHQRRPCG